MKGPCRGRSVNRRTKNAGGGDDFKTRQNAGPRLRAKGGSFSPFLPFGVFLVDKWRWGRFSGEGQPRTSPPTPAKWWGTWERKKQRFYTRGGGGANRTFFSRGGGGRGRRLSRPRAGEVPRSGTPNVRNLVHCGLLPRPRGSRFSKFSTGAGCAGQGRGTKGAGSFYGMLDLFTGQKNKGGRGGGRAGSGTLKGWLGVARC